ncbi:MAG: PRC-barrel domain-containing protein, partial [Clostridia bacterium]|nr:PRC-barrel domain-containing protein [Clostridia bacterium]
MAAGASGHTRLWVSGTVMTRNAVIGLPVIAMEDGRQLGEVVDVLVSSADGHVIGLLLDGGGPAGGFRVYPFEEVAAVGDGAVLVRNAAAVLTGRRQERLRALLQRHTTIVGRRVVGSGGDDLGCLVDIAFDVGTGRVTGYSLSR